jgi:F-type H+-transporting ATPase subunit epsilon
MKTVTIKIMTPKELVYQQDVDSIVFPAGIGETGVLPGHAPMISLLGTGNVRFHKDNKWHHCAVTGGVIKVDPQQVEVYSSTAQVWLDHP